MTGTSIRQAGGWWDGRRDTVGYTVQHCGPLGLRGHRPQGRRRVRRRPRLSAGRLRGGRRHLHPEARPGRGHRRPGDAAQLLHPGDRGAGRGVGAVEPARGRDHGPLHERPRRHRLQRRDHRLAVPGRAQRRGRADHAERPRSAAPPGGARPRALADPARPHARGGRASRRTSTWTRPSCRRRADRRYVVAGHGRARGTGSSAGSPRAARASRSACRCRPSRCRSPSR